MSKKLTLICRTGTPFTADGRLDEEGFRRYLTRFTDAKLGIFVHWGPYSVPAWAEPIGELGTIDPKYWFAHNPYAAWYYNTIRIPGSPAVEGHEHVPIKAPAAGTVMERLAGVGSVVAAATPVITISDLSSLWLIAAVDEKIGRAHV